MTRLLVQENWYLKQRAKVHWYRDGDLNTNFFHASALLGEKLIGNPFWKMLMSQ